jgi:eukaryotic-like serine/threonine-protein kinase
MAEDQDKLSEIFAEALAQASPQARERYLGEACGQDEELRDQVNSLLKAHHGAGNFLHHSVTRLGGNGASTAEGPGTVIGRYKLLQEIGEGGFGRVFMAEQREPVRRMVALKIIKAGMDTREVIARFEAERQALALMNHPNIAGVLDGGTTASGRPYFVMELVKGIPITDFCDQNNLPTERRLRLFMQVCAGVQHAHQKGIIHRDLKPSNVLVTVEQGQPVPKVIDFGIAKAIGEKLTERTLFTRFDQIVGTPAYMSPEQAEWGGIDIDTRSDIYSLGALLYELLTGTTPFEKDTLARAALDEVRRMIRETDPPKPSMRLQGLGQRLKEIAQQRQAEPSLLTHLVRGDLDWIVMKALDKDRARRYETASGLAMDLQRHLDNEPIVARPPSRRYEFQKSVRRHKLGFAAAGLVTAALAVGLGVSTWALRGETHARHQAENDFQTAREVVDQMLTRVAEGLAEQPQMEQLRRGLLEQALEYYQGFMQQHGNDPAVGHEVAQAQLRVAKIYIDLGQFETSVAPAERALTMLADLAQHHPHTARYREEIAQAHGCLGYAKMYLGRTPEHVDHQRQQVALCQELQREFPTVPMYSLDLARAHINLANAGGVPKDQLNEAEQGLKLYEEYRASFPGEPDNPGCLAWIHHWLGAALEGCGRLAEAEQHYQVAHELRKQLAIEQPQDLDLLTALAHIKAYLADLLKKTGRPREAEDLLKEAIAINERILLSHPTRFESRRRCALDYGDLGLLLLALHRTTEAEHCFQHALGMFTKIVTDEPGRGNFRINLAWAHFDLGLLLDTTGRSTEAELAFHEAVGILEELLAKYPDPPDYRVQLAKMLVTCPVAQYRNPARAAALVQQAMQRPPIPSYLWEVLGISQYRAGDATAAIESLQRMMEMVGGGQAEQWLYLAMAYREKGDHQQAQEWYDKAVAWIEEYHPASEKLDRIRAEADAQLGGGRAQ